MMCYGLANFRSLLFHAHEKEAELLSIADVRKSQGHMLLLATRPKSGRESSRETTDAKVDGCRGFELPAMSWPQAGWTAAQRHALSRFVYCCMKRRRPREIDEPVETAVSGRGHRKPGLELELINEWPEAGATERDANATRRSELWPGVALVARRR